MYYKKTVEDDIQIIDSDLKGMEKKTKTKSKSKKEMEEETRLTTLNVFPFLLFQLAKLYG